MNVALFNVAQAEIYEQETEGSDEHKVNPYLTTAKFVFADDKGAPLSTAPAGLLQGIEYEDFDEVIRTAINMPIKMKYTGQGAGNHLGSYVIGHITNMAKAQIEDGTHQLLADAVLYAEEFPEEVEYLKKAYADGEAPGISYEIVYEDSVVRNGVQWIKKLVTTAATFVREPAYGRRTALLALASAKNDEELVASMKAFIAQAEGSSGEGNINPSDKGGINVTEEELQKIKEEAEKAKALAETLQAEAASKTEEITRLTEEITALKTENTTLKTEKMLESRVRKMADAGFPLEADAEKSQKTKDFVLSLSDEAFDLYVENITAIKAAATSSAQASAGAGLAFASRQTTQIPRPEVVEDIQDLPSFRFR
jgi:hypothetical protein